VNDVLLLWTCAMLTLSLVLEISASRRRRAERKWRAELASLRAEIDAVKPDAVVKVREED
jgi:hypothetical protein